MVYEYYILYSHTSACVCVRLIIYSRAYEFADNDILYPKPAANEDGYEREIRFRSCGK